MRSVADRTTLRVRSDLSNCRRRMEAAVPTAWKVEDTRDFPVGRVGLLDDHTPREWLGGVGQPFGEPWGVPGRAFNRGCADWDIDVLGCMYDDIDELLEVGQPEFTDYGNCQSVSMDTSATPEMTFVFPNKPGARSPVAASSATSSDSHTLFNIIKREDFPLEDGVRDCNNATATKELPCTAQSCSHVEEIHGVHAVVTSEGFLYLAGGNIAAVQPMLINVFNFRQSECTPSPAKCETFTVYHSHRALTREEGGYVLSVLSHCEQSLLTGMIQLDPLPPEINIPDGLRPRDVNGMPLRGPYVCTDGKHENRQFLASMDACGDIMGFVWCDGREPFRKAVLLP